MNIYRFFLLFVVLLVVSCSSQNGNDNFLSEQQIKHFGATYVKWFYASNLDSIIVQIMNPDYTLNELVNFRNKVQSQLGHQVGLLNIQYGVEPWQHYYIQYAQFEKTEQPVRTLFTFDDQGRIYQFSVQTLAQESPTRYLNYHTKTKLALPFEGEWFVAWGGRAINENQHAVAQNQRFAYDFLIRKNGRTFSGSGKSNRDYFCYEQRVLAPAAGRIVQVVDIYPENKIGDRPDTHGNRVVIDHRNDEYSVLSHFKKGSIIVKEKQTVERGQMLGLCGNNGHSSEPHLHYHLQNSPDIDAAEGLPVTFQSYFCNEKFIQSGETQIGEYVKNHQL